MRTVRILLEFYRDLFLAAGPSPEKNVLEKGRERC